MASYPPPPYGLDPREQRRILKLQARAQRDAFRAQRDALKAQRALYRHQVRGFRRHSLLGPLLLLAAGVVLLLVRNGHVSLPQAMDFYSRWWPMLFVFAGAVVLIEWAIDQFAASLHPDAPPVARRTLGGGAVILLLLLSIFGAVSMGIHRHASQMFADFGGDGDNIAKFIGEKHDSDQSLDAALAPGSTLSIVNPHGDVTLSGGSQDGRIHISVQKEVYSTSDSEATRKTEQLSPRIETSGSQTSLTVSTIDGTNADLTITVPDTTTTNINSNHGDVRVTGIQSPVNVTVNHGDVELASIGADVNVRMNHNDSSFSAHNITGSVALKGHVQDLNLADIGGQVSLEGDFYGNTHLQQIRGSLRFHTSRTDLQLARLDGEIEISPDASLNVDRAAGPTVLTTRNRNITLDHMAGDVTVTNSNGTLDVTSAPPLGNLTLTNKRGSVNVTLPDHLGFSVDAGTTDGSLQNEFGLSTVEGNHKASIVGTIAKGGPQVKIVTTHGDIDLRKAMIAPLPPAPPEAPAPPSQPNLHLGSKPVPPRSNVVIQNGKDFMVQDGGDSVMHKDGKTIIHTKDGKTLELKDR